MTITIIRHGNTDFNLEVRAQGHMHNPLNKIGRQQARAVAIRLAEESWDMIVSSDLLRARETAEIISETVGMPITMFDVRLREIFRGRIEGTTEAERIERWGANWRELDLGEETDAALRKRGMECLEELANKYYDSRILVVSHGKLINQTLKGLLGNEAIGNLKNTSVTTIRKKDAGWECLLFNCINHLDADPSSTGRYH